MADVTNSALLQDLLERAKTYGNNPRASLTAERFLLAVLDLLDGSFGKKGDSFADFSARIESDKIDIPALKQRLLDHVTTGKQGILDSMYLSKKLITARGKASEAHQSELSAELLLQCILDEPTLLIQQVLRECVKKSGGAEEKPAGGSDISGMIANAGGLLGAITGKPAAAPQQPAQPADSKPDSDQKGVLSPDAISGMIAKQSGSILDQIGGSSAKTAPDGGSDETAAPTADESIEDLTVRTKLLRNKLLGMVFGQDHAVSLFASGYFQGELTAMTDPSRIRPRATFLFAGPPGVGKTLLAEKAAEALGLPYKRFDMSEYSDKEANLEFAGSDQVFKGASEGNVTGFVAKHPRCVLLFDEIEKAHLTVIHLFLQILDAGRLRDNYTDKEVSFKDAIIFITTNAGRGIYEENETENYAMLSRKTILRALGTDINPVTGGNFFPAAILSRFSSGNVVMFNHISAQNLLRIARKELKRQADNLEKTKNIAVKFDEAVYSALLFGEGGAADARAVRGRSENFFLTEIFELTRLVTSPLVETNVDSIKEIHFSVALPDESSPDVRELFVRGDDKPNVLLFSDEQTGAYFKSQFADFDFFRADSKQAGIDLLKENGIDFIVIDMNIGVRSEQAGHISVQDLDSVSRDFYRYVIEEQNAIPFFILEHKPDEYTEEERNGFLQAGVRSLLTVGPELGDRLHAIALDLYQQANMLKLARASKVLRFETRQEITENGSVATIQLYDFALRTAIDSEDQKSILTAAQRPDVRFDQVIGAKDAKRELQYFVEYLKNPKKYLGTGVSAPHGVLLYGPPGTGKTMLGKAMAAESGVTFLAAEGNSFISKWVGDSAKLVHEMFRKARKYAPSILFIDEIDTLAKKRTGDSTGGSSETQGALTALLAEMDGFKKDPSRPVFVLGATNYDADENSEKGLDGAVLRRFDRCIYVDLPRKEDRVRFIRMKLDNQPAFRLSEDEISNITVRSTGMSLANLESIFEMALRTAIRTGETVVDDAIFEEAFETFMSGDEKKWDESTLLRTARHESGHTFLAWEYGENPSYVTVVARGTHGGYMQHEDREDKPISTRDDLLARIRTSLGGRAAEIVYYGNSDGLSTGPSSDLQHATNTAKSLLCYYGMSDDLGLAVLTPDELRGSQLSVSVHDAVNRILNEQLAEAIRLISENRAAVDALTQALLDEDHLSGEEINAVLSKHAVRRGENK